MTINAYTKIFIKNSSFFNKLSHEYNEKTNKIISELLQSLNS